MLVFWRGKGLWAVIPLIGWIVVLTVIFIATAGPDGDPNAVANTDRLFSLMFALAAVTVFFIARRRGRDPLAEIDPATGQTVLVPHYDHFMFINLKYWPYVYAAIAAYLLIKSFFE